MCDRCVIYAEAVILCPTLEFCSCEGRTQIYDDSIGHLEVVHNVLDELDCFGCTIFCEWFVFNPLSELVNCYKDVLKTALCFLERSHLIQPPAGERLSGWNADEVVGWHMSLSCEHLTTFASSNKFFYVFQSGWPVETSAKCFAD